MLLRPVFTSLQVSVEKEAEVTGEFPLKKTRRGPYEMISKM